MRNALFVAGSMPWSRMLKRIGAALLVHSHLSLDRSEFVLLPGNWAPFPRRY